MIEIKVKNLSKTYEVDGVLTEVVRDINFTISAGDSVCLFGPSGAGKSTLLYLMSGLESPSNGSVFYNESNIVTFSEELMADFRNKQLGFVFQSHHLLPDFTALENIMMPLLIAGISQARAKQEALHLLDQVGLSKKGQNKPSQLSGGEQQRVALARAVIHKPQIIFADEPSGNLDHENGVKIFDLLLGLNRELRATLVVVTHDESMAGLFNKKIKILDGRIDT